MGIRILSLIFAIFLTHASFAQESCRETLPQKYSRGITYALGITKATHQITYGLEVEFFPHSQNRNILNDYCPEGVSESQWLQMPLEQRAAEYTPRTETAARILKKMKHAPEWMPSELEPEFHGTHEAEKFIFNDFDSLLKTLHKMEDRYGKGAAQTHIVFPTESALKANAGFIAFSGELAQLKNLEAGYEKYLTDPSKVPGRNFEHHALRPIDNEGINELKRSEDQIFKGDLPSRIWDGKRFLSTVLRGGKYGNPKRAGYELRQFNYDYEGLLAETLRTAEMLELGLVPQFKIFDRDLSPSVLDQFFARDPTKKAEWDKYVNARKEFYSSEDSFIKSILFGFRNWADHPVLAILAPEQREAKRAVIMRAQQELFTEFNSIVTNSKGLYKEDQEKFRIAVATFAYKVQLGTVFDQHYNSLITRARAAQNRVNTR